MATTSQARYWMLTIPRDRFQPCRFDWGQAGVDWACGQCEKGTETGYEHWQFICHFQKKIRLRGVRKIFGPHHAEPTRSESATSYVTKENTRIEGTQFEFGRKPVSRARQTDWDNIRRSAQLGKLEEIPSDVFVRNYTSLKKIATDHMKFEGMERQCFVFWGDTHCGKSHRAWQEAGLTAFPKISTTKFWCGYQNHEHVVIDEFRGDISITHLLKWTDKWPVCVETKHGAIPFCAKKIWITSNLHPKDWYPNLDQKTLQALLRRLTITHFSQPFKKEKIKSIEREKSPIRNLIWNPLDNPGPDSPGPSNTKCLLCSKSIDLDQFICNECEIN